MVVLRTEEITFEQVRRGDILFVKTDNNKKGEPVAVVSNIIVGRGQKEGPCHKIMLENGDVHFGWAKRFLKKVVDEPKKIE